jgi:glyoxylase-like metal-dependent hydrolase (beta-lactamase superfamily II)
MSFWFAEQKLLIAGDTLFRRGVGRTDLWGGDQRTIVRSIKERLYRLDEDAIVVTGHGPKPALAMKCAKTRSCVPEVAWNFSALLQSKAGTDP